MRVAGAVQAGLETQLLALCRIVLALTPLGQLLVRCGCLALGQKQIRPLLEQAPAAQVVVVG